MKIRESSLYLKCVKFLLVWCILQDFVLSTLYNLTGSILLTDVFFYTKDILLILLFLSSIKRMNFRSKLGKLIVAYFAVVIIALLLGLINGGSVTNIAQNTRGVILLPCFICIGHGIKNAKREEFDEFIKTKYLTWILISVCFGLIDYFLDITIGTKYFWRNIIGITSFLTDIKHQANRLLFDLPGNFYGYGEGGSYFSRKRLVGFWGSPLTCAYALLLPAFFYLLKVFYNRNKHIDKSKTKDFLICVLYITGIFLSYTRAIIIVLIIIFAAYTFIYANRNVPLFLLVISTFLVCLFAVDYSTIRGILYDGSTIGHINGIIGGLTKIEPSLFGHGINYAGVEGTGVGTESTYLTLLGNIGIVGLILFIIIFIYSLKAISRNSTDIITKAVMLTGIGLMVTGVVSEQLLAYTTIAPFFIMLGNELAKDGYRSTRYIRYNV